MVERYRNAGGVCKPVDLVCGLVRLAEKEQQVFNPGFQIQLHPRSFEGDDLVFGGLVRYPAYCEILYSTNLTTCWRRFIIAKELAHLIFDKDDNFTSDPIELVTSLLAGIPLSEGAIAAVTSEQQAVLMAIELILPHTCREDVEKMAAAGSSALEIAIAYRVPQKVVENYLNSGYKKMAATCWDLRGR